MKKFIIVCLSVLFLFACSALTACGKTPAESGEQNEIGGETGGQNGGSGSSGGDNGEGKGDAVGERYLPPAYDENLPEDYFGTYYLIDYTAVKDGKIAAIGKADEAGSGEYSAEKYNVTVFSDNSVRLNFGGRTDKSGYFNTEEKILSVERNYISSLGTAETEYDNNLKFEFLNGALVLLKTVNGVDGQTLTIYNFKKGVALGKADYPVTVNSFNGVYVQKHADNENYLRVTINGNVAEVEKITVGGEVFNYSGIAVLLFEGDNYKLAYRYDGNTKSISFDYALDIISDYEKQ